jgi:hypothetical protein
MQSRDSKKKIFAIHKMQNEIMETGSTSDLFNQIKDKLLSGTSEEEIIEELKRKNVNVYKRDKLLADIKQEIINTYKDEVQNVINNDGRREDVLDLLSTRLPGSLAENILKKN